MIVEIEVRDTVYLPDPRTNGQWYVDTLMSYLGAKEIDGSNSGPVVDLFFQGCGVPPGNPWCACYLNRGLIDIGKQGPNAPAWTPSWFPASNTFWTRGDPNMVFPVGSVFGIYFRSLGRVAHVGAIVSDFGDGYVLTVEGNTNSAGGREGNGVYVRIRHKSEIYKVSRWD